MTLTGRGRFAVSSARLPVHVPRTNNKTPPTRVGVSGVLRTTKPEDDQVTLTPGE